MGRDRRQKAKPTHEPSDEERWKKFVEEYGHMGAIAQSEFGIIDTSEDAMKDVTGGEDLSYEEYMQGVLQTKNGERK